MITYNFDNIIDISHNDISHLKIDISDFMKNYQLNTEDLFPSITECRVFKSD